MSEIRVDAILLNSVEPAELARFYSLALGLEEPKAQGSDHLGMRAGNIYLGFDLVESGSEGGRGASAVWFKVEDAAATHDAMLELGARSIEAPHACPPNETLAKLSDPEGNVVGLISEANSTT